MNIITRFDAKQLGLAKYYTGSPCKRGHLAERSTSNGKCCQCHREDRKDYYGKNREAETAKMASYYVANKPKLRKQQKQYQTANRAQYNANSSRHRAGKQQATPGWFEHELVANVYQKAKQFGFQVDHIVPLNSKVVCGLHCWANIQLLSPELNRSKGNRDWPDSPFSGN